MRYIVAVFLLFILGCRAAPKAEELLPPLAGWELTSEGVYTPANLHEHINGAADVFVEYGLKRALSRSYKSLSLTVTVDVYEMVRPERAFGMFSLTKNANSTFASIGERAIVSPQQIIFYQANFYVDVQADNSGPQASAALREFAIRISARIKTITGTPAIMQVLPKDNLVAESEKLVFGRLGLQATFLKGELIEELPLADIAGAVYGSYSILNDSYELLIISCKSDAVAEDVGRQFGVSLPEGVWTGTAELGNFLKGQPVRDPQCFHVRNLVVFISGRISLAELFSALSWVKFYRERAGGGG